MFKFAPRGLAVEADRGIIKRKSSPPAQAASEPDADSIAKRLTTAGVDDKLAKILELWVDAKWLKKVLRHRALKELLTKLGAPDVTAEKRMLLCRQFIEKHLASEAAMHGEALKLLEAWEAATGV